MMIKILQNKFQENNWWCKKNQEVDNNFKKNSKSLRKENSRKEKKVKCKNKFFKKLLKMKSLKNLIKVRK